MDKHVRNSCAVLVLSCDKYSSLWFPFFSQFDKFWTDCPYKVYLGSNTKSFKYKGVKVINSGRYIDWSSNLLSILNQINEDYIFIWLEDLFPTYKVNTKKFIEGFSFMHRKHANHIHFDPTVIPDNYLENRKFGLYKRGAPYRVSTVGFWNKDHLKKILLPGENPWQFEIFGSYRSSFSDGYYCYNGNLFNYVQLVERGKLFREGYHYCRQHNIDIDLNQWQIHSVSHKIKSDINRCIFYVIIKIPWQIRLSLMNVLRKVFASY